MANTKVAIFVDGKNFYEGLRASGLTNKIDFEALSQYMVKAVGGGMLTGLHYYTGIEPIYQSQLPSPSQSENENDGNGEEKEEQQKQKRGGLDGFLLFLETQPGCFVYRFPRRVRRVICNECGHEHSYTEEKAVDTSLVATMIRQAAIGVFDSSVLCSGDADHTPALEALRDLGKPTWVATFGGHGLSRRLRQAAYGHIDLSAAHNKYAEGIEDEEKSDDEYNVVAALEEAEKYFGDERYVGYNMFVKDWRSDHLPKDNIVRRKRLVQDMIENGQVEAYEADDGCRALKTINISSDADCVDS